MHIFRILNILWLDILCILEYNNGENEIKKDKKKEGFVMTPIRTVLFDMDGTLLNTLDDLRDSVNYALAQYGFPPRSLEEIRCFVGNGVRKLVERAVPDGTDAAQLDACFAAFLAYYETHNAIKTAPYEGVIPVLEALRRRGVRVGVVSNKIDGALQDLTRLYFGDLVEVAVGNREGLACKPAPDTVYVALGELSETAETAVYVGDSDVDVKTAHGAGLPCVSVLWGFRTREDLLAVGADTFVETPEELLAYLETLL